MGKTLQAPRRRGLGPTSAPDPQFREVKPTAASATTSLPLTATAGVIPADRRRINYTGPLEGIAAYRDLPSPPTVSVICPTYNRHAMHERLYQNFRAQDYPAKDFWVLEDTYTISPFFSKCTDPQVHYLHITQKRTIGAKRNHAIQVSKGSIIVHFDDDDIYRPNYISSMVEALVREDADFVKLAMWNEHRLHDDYRRVFDARRQRHPNMWGFGFSYVYRRFVGAHASFPNINSGEDYAFLVAVQNASLKTVLIEGGADWVEHVLHGRNVSRKE
jgi:cellulose synthase/poly-beta-1,6-N-acetylglucosamine synthase-like glycosyltransferase